MLEQIGFLKLTFSKHSKNPVIALKWLIILQFVYILHQCDSRGVIPLLLLPPSAPGIQATAPQERSPPLQPPPLHPSLRHPLGPRASTPARELSPST